MTRFVGRVEEFAALAGLLGTAGAGIALVSGEPGIGKTRLTAEFGRLADGRDWQVLRARASDEEGAPGFWLWRQVVRDWLAVADEPTRHHACAQHGPTLAPILPEFTPDGPSSAGPVSAEQRFTVFERFGQFLAEVSAHRPTLVVLDDLHWADAGSLSLLTHLAGQARDGRLLIVGTFRPAEFAARPLSGQLRALVGRHENGVHVELSGLSTAEVGAQLTALLGEQPDPELITTVQRRTHGNPLFVQEVSRLLAAGRPPADGVPEVIRDAILQHLAVLPPDCMRTLTVAAVVGTQIDPTTVAAIAQTPIDVVLTQLEQAHQAGVLTDGFVHDLFRETVYLQLTKPDRASIHLRVAEYLETIEPQRVAEIARHRLAALPLGEAAVASAAAQAAGRVAMAELAFENAAELFDRAVKAQPGAIRALIDAGRAWFLTGDTDSAIDRCTRAAELAQRSGDAESLGRAALALPELSDPGWLSLAQAWCEQALAGLSGEDGSLRAQLLAQQALVLVVTDKVDRMLAASEAALAMAERTGDVQALRIALRARQIARSTPDGHADRLAIGERMLRLGRETGDLDAVFWGHLWQFDAHVQAGRIDAAQLELTWLSPVVTRIGQDPARWPLWRSQAALAMARGDFAYARTLVDAIRGLARIPFDATVCAPQRLLISRLTGQEENHAEWPRGPQDHPFAVFSLFLHLAPWYLEFGAPEEAAKFYRQLPAIDSVRLAPYLSLLVTAVRGEVAAALGDADGAAILYDRLLPHADLHVTTGAGLNLTLGSVQYYLGLTAQQPEDAVAHFEKAIDANQKSGFTSFAAQAHYRLGQALRDLDPGRAEQAARTAHTLADQVGMVLLASRAAALDQNLRGRSPLTPRQREVAALIAKGHTNRQVATALHISERTAESHVQNIMSTLSFQSRSQIAAWSAQNQH